MELFDYLMAKKGHNTGGDLFSYLLGKNAGGSGTYTTFSGTSLNISNTLQAKIKNIALEGNTSQDGTPTPDAPIPIKVVTGEQNVEISGKNLFDKNAITDVSTYRSTATINNDKSITITSTGTNGYAIIRPFFNFKANETYTVSFDVDNISNYNHMYLFINASTTGGGYSKNPYVTITRTADVSLGIGIYPNGNATITISNIQIEKNSSKTSFEPYYTPQTYPLSLGNIELAKIGNYKDYIFKNVTGSPYYNADLDLNGWYKYKAINKIILDGSENWEKRFGNNLFNIQRFLDNRMSIVGYGLSNYYKYNSVQSGIDANTSNGEFVLQLSFGGSIFLKNTDFDNVENFKIWLSNHNTEIIYPLATPTYTKITDTTLITQLENLNNARSYKGTTIIECTSESADNEVIGFSGDIKVTSVGLGNPLNTSLLSNNIQEETNLDDVNEIEETEEEVS